MRMLGVTWGYIGIHGDDWGHMGVAPIGLLLGLAFDGALIRLEKVNRLAFKDIKIHRELHQ